MIILYTCNGHGQCLLSTYLFLLYDLRPQESFLAFSTSKWGVLLGLFEPDNLHQQRLLTMDYALPGTIDRIWMHLNSCLVLHYSVVHAIPLRIEWDRANIDIVLHESHDWYTWTHLHVQGLILSTILTNHKFSIKFQTPLGWLANAGPFSCVNMAVPWRIFTKVEKHVGDV